jgi:hypothetical protein
LADLTDLQAAQTVKIAGSNSSGIESTYAEVANNNDLKVQDGLSEGGVYGTLSMTTANTAYEAKVGASRLANRKSLIIIAQDNMFWGYNNSVTTTTGIPIYKDQQLIFSIDSDSTFQVWLVASANTKTAKIAESP